MRYQKQKFEDRYKEIQFSRKGRAKTAKEKQAISKGLEEFWDKKGRSVMKVGAAATGTAGLLLLAGKSGKVKLPKGGLKNVRNNLNNPGVSKAASAAAKSLRPTVKPDNVAELGKDVVKTTRMLPGASEVGTSGPLAKSSGSSGGLMGKVTNGGRDIVQRGRKLGNEVINTGQATRAGFDEGYATANTEQAKKGGGVFGRAAARIANRGKQDIAKSRKAIKDHLQKQMGYIPTDQKYITVDRQLPGSK